MKYQTTTEAAKLMGVCARQVQRYCEQGQLGQKIGRNWAITDADITKFLGGVTHWKSVIVRKGETLVLKEGDVYRHIILRGGTIDAHFGEVYDVTFQKSEKVTPKTPT